MKVQKIDATGRAKITSEVLLIEACKTAIAHMTGGSIYGDYHVDAGETLLILKDAIATTEKKR